ncbi:heparin-binding hemagglutinin [Rhodococcus sp. BP-252]|uniref:Heparin-binding hemagglutinin n=1 Tax=Rhodococcoides kyotonense TaxID=398843 RepID=A0A177Y964_9NOCA|nr:MULTISPECIES: heparin-binding hemagglutinin [Rhodococcus]MBY6413687.1 heparin-binding hemagglutinin [Rhodococcus sp. BP-320]MBY6418326.1 heparin-binding hemagglutinin [Rhodococcus sp. BP-321]MBY6422451.1 heparin-binding hemagglutinin [Rhodococcus sp. BP-324]MBY6428271.1 heparin-binding hemagglutinin [Rhodococcus sp. BP-323]MBY6433448.1 heparin-binding hemagglutinin [Rhodococcus sp. BP-322]
MTDARNLDNVKTPLYAAVGAGDAVVQAVADVVAQVRSRAEVRGTEVTDRVDTARARLADFSEDVTEGVESLRERLANLPAELPDEIAELRERFTPDELRKVAEAYLKVASDLYTSLAERGEETVERIRRTPAVEEGLGRANAAANDVVDLTEQALGTVASQTRAVGERAAALAGIASDKVRDTAEDLAEEIDEAGDNAKEAATDASQKVSGVAGKVESKTRANQDAPLKKTAPAAKKATPATAAKKTAAPAKKAPAKKTTS